MAYGCTYPIEMYCDRTVRFDRCGVAAQRNHFPEDTDCLIGEGVKVLGIYARSSFGGHCSTDVALRGDGRYEQVMDVSGSPYLINQAMITSVSKGRSRQHVIAAKYHQPCGDVRLSYNSCNGKRNCLRFMYCYRVHYATSGRCSTTVHSQSQSSYSNITRPC